MPSIDGRSDPDLEELQRGLDAQGYAFLLGLDSQSRRYPIECFLRRLLAWPSAFECSAKFYHQVIPAPASLDTPDPWVDDPLFDAAIKLKLKKPNWEGAWHLQGDIHVPAGSPIVFVDGRVAMPSLHLPGEDKSILAHLSAWKKNGLSTKVKRVILLRDTWYKSYWHLLHDLLPRIPMADALGISKEVPVVVSERFMQRFSTLLQATNLLKDRQIIVQSRKEAIRCEELFLLRPASFSRQWAEGVLERIPIATAKVDRTPRIYCRRGNSSARGRLLDDDEQVERIFRSAGFAIVDPATMSLPEQRALFQQAEIIAGVNGGALANAIFRCGRPLTIGVLVSSRHKSVVIPTFAKTFCHRYVGFVVPTKGNLSRATVTAPRATVEKLIDHIC